MTKVTAANSNEWKPTPIPVLVLDLDGTLRHTKSGKPNPVNLDDIAIYDDVAVRIKPLIDDGWFICCISNQGGVSYGIRTIEQMKEELEYTVGLLTKQGVVIHTLYACFHHPKGKIYPYNVRSLLRKPYYGMLVNCEMAASEQGLVLDWDQSIFVGDSADDQECAIAAGLQFVSADVFFKRKVTQNGEIDIDYNVTKGITQYTAQWWPMCPHCGEDSLISHDDSQPDQGLLLRQIQPAINAGMHCAVCDHTIEPRD